MRIMDGLMSIPSVLIAIALMALTRASMQNVVFAITVAEVPRVTRLVRGVVLTLRELPFVEAAHASGTGYVRILWRHILPYTLPPLLVNATFVAAAAMIVEAILSFLGVGTPPIAVTVSTHTGAPGVRMRTPARSAGPATGILVNRCRSPCHQLKLNTCSWAVSWSFLTHSSNSGDTATLRTPS